MGKIMGRIILQIYVQPLNRIVGVIFVLTIAWGLCGCIKNKIWKIFNIFVFLCSVVAIAYITILKREAGNVEVILMPFHSFVEAQIQPEMYRSMLMNGFLFLPYGLALPFSLPDRFQGIRKVFITIVTAMVFSIVTEMLQYCFHLGRCETDDVIMNTLGAVVGTLAYVISIYVKKKQSKL